MESNDFGLGQQRVEEYDDLDDMYLDPLDSGSTTRTLRTASSNASFRSAFSGVDRIEDIDMSDEITRATTPEHDSGAQRMGTNTAGTNPTRVDPKEPDLISEVRGMYRILDLVSEQGSGGLVDKIVISQESLGRFINSIKPGTYTSMTKVAFSALDTVEIQPRGIYGSRFEIVRFLQDLGAIDSSVAHLLRNCRDDASTNSGRTLRSGLYMLRGQSVSLVYCIYWPEETTWNDNAPLSVQKNRVTFMRYLTKIADQLVALISDAHGAAIQWNDQPADAGMDIDDDEIDRLFSFEVQKTNEQEEQATARPGFSIDLNILSSRGGSDDFSSNVDPEVLRLPRLVPGETTCGIMYAEIIRPRKNTKRLSEKFTEMKFRTTLGSESFRLSRDISDEALQCLLQAGLGQTRGQEETRSFVTQRQNAITAHDTKLNEHIAEFQRQLADKNGMLVGVLQCELVKATTSKFSTIDELQLMGSHWTGEDASAFGGLKGLFELYPKFKDSVEAAINPHSVKIIAAPFKDRKKRLLSLEQALLDHPELNEEGQQQLTTSMINDPLPSDTGRRGRSSLKELVTSAMSYIPMVNFSSSEGSKTTHTNFDISDVEFLSKLTAAADKFPCTATAIQECMEMATQSLASSVKKKSNDLASVVEAMQLEAFKIQIRHELDGELRDELSFIRRDFLSAAWDSFVVGDKHVIILDDVTVERRHSGSAMYSFNGTHELQSDAKLQYTVYQLQLTQEDRHSLQTDPAFIPSPKIRPRDVSICFRLPLDYNIRHIQLLEDRRCLIVTESGAGLVKIYLEKYSELDRVMEFNIPKKQLHCEKIGRDYLVAYDETKRMLAICGSEQKSLNVFLFDEKYTSLQGLGSPVDLKAWYDNQTRPTHMTFVCGQSEELALVDTSGLARTYSLTTQQFRPASLQLLNQPTYIHSSPDGSCLLSTECDNGGWYIRAYHWTNFGTTDGICLTLDGLPLDSCIVTSFGTRAQMQMHYVGMDVKGARCESVALDITRKVTEFTFKEKGGQMVRYNEGRSSAHNCIVECFSDVWTRFPVVPAVQRETVKASDGRQPYSILFVSNISPSLFRLHFREMVSAFERTTRKPTDGKLDAIEVDAMPYDLFMEIRNSFKLSLLRAGEWLVDILCLIPIHIAVTRDNRFVPLKDGISSPELERTLLGATVGQIVDNLTFGWYESIFESYMASKPVRVVSSMGEQSVGKSFALNHLVDTSFAGSAMRTTEGVWMSVTPTDSALIVALDFEGVHSIERSAQEDTLLVLFNTALSNLVLFRNNFAMSRDIAGLFQSFQSSSTILDPAANPSLFKSMLVIIIKDVVDSDKREITKEFRLKFQSIVAVEQGSNFITRLHGGKLTIVPWPVIESRQFYTLYPAMKKMLDAQEITHPKAGIFLQTMKTLMAKLRANDWGALDQNLASHRAQQLLALLPRALSSGTAETEPDEEPLKDFDSGDPIGLPDTHSMFYLFERSDAQKVSPESQAVHLQALLAPAMQNTDQHDTDQTEWVRSLEDRLDRLATLRINHVREWLASNTVRFDPDLPQLQEVRQAFDNLVITMKANIKICGSQCSSCQLACISVYHHDGRHDCHTSHECPHVCDYTEDHFESPRQMCGLPAGHSKTHICDISAHLCGQRCKFHGRAGCLEYCSKMVNHEDNEHICPAMSHQCGEPCGLQQIQLPNGAFYNCPGSCHFPVDQYHEDHACEKQSCPLQCELCKRLCASCDHMHAVAAGRSPHLCGQDHPCTCLCQMQGICQIETAPQSIEATFTGRHESFQYTKYSQASKRLPCVVRIPSGEISHNGPHVHTTDRKAFHFCETRCEQCGYFCTLPLGHPQQEHETSHGSMSKTRWAVEGAEGTIVEVNGRKFASRDDGAPMLCSMYCREMGRHVHIDDCRSAKATNCSGAGTEHIKTRVWPNPEVPKDYISHTLHWRRTGFKDPYSHDDQNAFAKCDFLCSGQEHQADAAGVAHPSHCTLDVLHPPLDPNQAPPGGIGYISRDGHHFSCRNPAQMQQAFHVMFVIDRSGSMGYNDRRPLQNTPITQRLTARHDNRLGAVYSSLYSFWVARHAAVNAGGGQGNHRRDAYSVILFESSCITCVDSDFTSTPDDLLTQLLGHDVAGGTNYTVALNQAQSTMEANWSTERSPVVIFLSDGECSVNDETVRALCRRAIALGRALSFHAVAFGPRNEALRRMAQIANEVESRAPQDPMHPLVASSYTEALDTVRLAETFLGLADSLRKPRGALVNT
ncbi:hypothetical protein BXZ70DRAFT_339404 [Cristinia sonorae]|uniref:VWFA domain-containing protein n=1 Tax=Cristinia sonorae TaxID=1940300 RepID=A0A8K0UKH1_9AGAR|nr:hypothetical protein BXZ70DRAFT_339404 [Cristinia sonorae]